jgi:thiamine phosphate synthase YjbQ (UPF0047 family)
VAAATTGSQRIVCQELLISTRPPLCACDVTVAVDETVRASGISAGIALVYSAQATCSLQIAATEDVARLVELIERLAPETDARCRAMLLGSVGVAIPVRDGALCLGARERVLLLELGDEGSRRVLVSVLAS